MTVIRVSVVGAAGYSGAEAIRILARHPHVALAGLFGSPGGKGAAFGDLHPDLAGLDGPDVVPFSEAALLAQAPDAAILATPNEVSAELAPKLLAARSPGDRRLRRLPAEGRRALPVVVRLHSPDARAPAARRFTA